MTNVGRGVAYALWRKVEMERIRQGLDKAELAKLTSLARSTIDGLKNGLRAPKPKTVHALADVLHIDRREAEVLAGLQPDDTPRTADVDVRAAIEASEAYTEEQRAMLLAMVDTIEKANGLKPDQGGERRAI